MMEETIKVVREIIGKPILINPNTKLFTELDLDSLQMIELIDTLKLKFGVDFSSVAHTLSDIETPEAIVAALERSPK